MKEYYRARSCSLSVPQVARLFEGFCPPPGMAGPAEALVFSGALLLLGLFGICKLAARAKRKPSLSSRAEGVVPSPMAAGRGAPAEFSFLHLEDYRAVNPR